MASKRKIKHIDILAARQNAEKEYDSTLASLVNQLNLSLDTISVDGKYYVDAEQIFRVTSVDEAVFQKAATAYQHFVKYKKRLYASRYGLLLIVSLSKEPAAIALVDYILSIFIKLEMTGCVTREDVKDTKQALDQQISSYKIDIPGISAVEVKKIQDLIRAKGIEIIEMPSTISRLERECRVISKGLETLNTISKDVQGRNTVVLSAIEKTKHLLENLSKLTKYLNKSSGKTFASPQVVKDTILSILDSSVLSELSDVWSKINITEKTSSDEFITVLNELKCDLDDCSSIRTDQEDEEAQVEEFDKAKMLEDAKIMYEKKGYKVQNLDEYNIVFSKRIYKPADGTRYDWDVMTDKELEAQEISQKKFPIYAQSTYNSFQEISDDFKSGILTAEVFPFSWVLCNKIYLDVTHRKIISQLFGRFNPLTESDALFIIDLITSFVKNG